MRIMGLTDIHCSYHYSSQIAYKALEEKIDLIIIAGDIECIDPLENIIGTGIPAYGVTGNMDDHYLYRYMVEKGVAIDGRTIEIGDLVIAGIGGLSFSNNLEKVSNELEKYKGKQIVIVSHYPPKGFNDRTYSGVHAGLPQLRELMEKYRPILFFHGHIHEARGIVRYGNIVIVNPGPLMHGYYSTIDIDGEVKVSLKRI